ncbi:MAG TPA: hypothetical protein VG096_18055 [Bryobacteraceae bacterium]|nr:hypothetical protein [Bryobacteraceae bacterium]
MSTQRQIEANRLNAQKSTGPRTPEGKAVSSQNALKSGLDADSQFVIGESGDEFAAFQHEYTTRFQPLTPEERFKSTRSFATNGSCAASFALKPTCGNTMSSGPTVPRGRLSAQPLWPPTRSSAASSAASPWRNALTKMPSRN